jgi:hypothetical protein
MDYRRPTFEIQGVELQVKPTSPINMKKMQEFSEEIDVSDFQGEDETEKLAKMNMELLRRVAEPVGEKGLDEIDPMHMDMNKVQHYAKFFMNGPNMT